MTRWQNSYLNGPMAWRMLISEILCLSTNDSFLVSAAGGNLELYNNITRVRMTTLYEPTDPSNIPTAFGFNPTDNNFFAIGLNNGNIILKALKQKKGWERPGHTQTAITDLGFVRATKERGTLITTARDGGVKIWNFEIPPEKGASDFELDCKNSFKLGPHITRVHLRPNQHNQTLPQSFSGSEANDENVKFLIEQPTQLEIRSLDGRRHNMWVPEGGSILGVAYDCSGSHLYVLVSNQTLLILSNELLPSVRVSLEKSYMALAANPKEKNNIALGDQNGTVVVFRVNK